MDAKLRSTWTSKAAQAALSPAAPLQVGAIAALPVLPTAFSSANAEPRRVGEARSSGSGNADHGGVEHAMAAFPGETLPEPPHVAPLSLTDPGQAATAPVRVNDLSQRPPGDAEAPACRPGETAGADRGEGEGDGAAAEPAARPQDGGQAEQAPPPPHCAVEFDPDSVEPDIIAHAPIAPTAKGPTKMAQMAASTAATAQPHPASADKSAGQIATEAPGHPADASAQTQQATAEAAAGGPAPAATTTGLAPTHAAPASDAPLVMTDATRGLGAQVIDPLLPVDSVVFASDLALLFPSGPHALAPELAQPLAADPVGDALAASAAGGIAAAALAGFLADHLLIS